MRGSHDPIELYDECHVSNMLIIFIDAMISYLQVIGYINMLNMSMMSLLCLFHGYDVVPIVLIELVDNMP